MILLAPRVNAFQMILNIGEADAATLDIEYGTSY